MINNFKSWFNNTFERTDHKKDRVQLKYIFTQYKQDTFYNNLNKQGKRYYNKKHFIKMFGTLYNQYLKTNNNGVYIITNHKLKTDINNPTMDYFLENLIETQSKEDNPLKLKAVNYLNFSRII